MANLNSVLSERLKNQSNRSKMEEMAKKSASGQLTTFSGVFSLSELTEKEKEHLSEILHHYAPEKGEISRDLEELIAITSEVKAIHNQAALLHGERIKRVHKLLISYRDGAFTAWMMAAYGNRQTPYNLMQYFDFWQALPKNLRTKVEEIPRQAIYILASRDGLLEDKKRLVEAYEGESKKTFITRIREKFPLDDQDLRLKKTDSSLLGRLEALFQIVQRRKPFLKQAEKKQLLKQLKNLQDFLQD